MSASVFAAVFAAMAAGHQVGDYWVQTSAQAAAKGGPGWAGRRACAAHVATYTLTLAACVALAGWWLPLPLSAGWVAAGLGVSGGDALLRRPACTAAAAGGRGRRWRVLAHRGRAGDRGGAAGPGLALVVAVRVGADC